MTDVEYLFAAVIATYLVLGAYAFWVGRRAGGGGPDDLAGR